MKTNLLFMALGAALMFAVMTLIERNSAPELGHSDAENEQKPNLGSPLSATDEPQPVSIIDTETEIATQLVDSSLNNELAIELSTEDTPSKKATRSAIPEDVKKLLTRDANRRAKRFLKKAIGVTNPKLDSLQSFAQIKLRADEQHQNESNIFTDNVDFSLYGKDGAQLTPEQQELIDQWETNREQLDANLESNRQSYEDSVRNLLNPEELEQYRAQESLIADQFFDTSVESLTESYRESISDLNDYQHTQLDNIIKQSQALEPALVPIGSTLEGIGYSSSHNSLNNSERYTNVFTQIEAVLSDQQREQIRKNGLQYVYGGTNQ